MIAYIKDLMDCCYPKTPSDSNANKSFLGRWRESLPFSMYNIHSGPVILTVKWIAENRTWISGR